MTTETRDRRRRFTAAQSRRIAERHGGKCFRCGADLPSDFHAHHLIPWASGGPTVVSNGVPYCGGCHRSVHREGC